MTDVARRVRVHGRVQGVWFRDSCRAEAESRGVRGWVSNEPDGTVAGHFEGPAEAVDALVAWCRTGPPRADVRGVDVEDAEVEGVAGFQAR
jgi:acylphosphatase